MQILDLPNGLRSEMFTSKGFGFRSEQQLDVTEIFSGQFMCKEEVSTLPSRCSETDTVPQLLATAPVSTAAVSRSVDDDLVRVPPFIEAMALSQYSTDAILPTSGSSSRADSSPSAQCNGSLSDDQNSTPNCAVSDAKNDSSQVPPSQDNKTSTDLGGSDAAPPPENSEEVFLIQDSGFSVKIHAPGCEPFELQVSSMELVQEIHQILMDHEETCHRTCFSLQLDGQILDSFAELKAIPGLKDGATLKVVEEPYTVREARIHLRHVRDLLKSLDPSDAYNSSECASLSYVNTITNGSISERTGSNLESSVDCTPPDYIMPGCKERLISPLMP
ncbi:unnamed protein product, partial [Soboliphyme baturini]|uniref:CLU_N domain-containing protein n=1 Tax=Soboliphyme baturini TaxID=241478 RepID=A0A183ILR8_9BILA